MEFWMFDTPFGPMAAGEEGGAVTRLWLPNAPLPRIMPHRTTLLGRVEEELTEYFLGQRQDFDLPLSPVGTPFQRRVWQGLREIPWGEVISYGELARTLGCPGGARAVGAACRSNPIPVLIPCHRVVGGDGSLTGYAGGMELKCSLLELEGISIIKNPLPRLKK